MIEITPTGTSSASATAGAAPGQPGSTTATPNPPEPTLAQGWQTYIWAEQHIAIDYPPGWSVQLQVDGPVFSSSQQQVIKLSRVAASGKPAEDYLAPNDLPNTRCATIKNRYGVDARTCFDTIARTTSAYLVITPRQGEAVVLLLVAEGHIVTNEVDGIIQTVRAAP